MWYEQELSAKVRGAQVEKRRVFATCGVIESTISPRLKKILHLLTKISSCICDDQPTHLSTWKASVPDNSGRHGMALTLHFDRHLTPDQRERTLRNRYLITEL